MPVNETIVDSVAIDNLKAIAGKLSAVAAESFQQFAAHQNRVNTLAETALANTIKAMNEMDPKEALSIVESLKGSDTLAEQMSQFGTLVAQLQQVMKGAQTTPPVT